MYLKQSVDLFPHIPAELVKISESGINFPEDVHMLKEVGYNGFLIGEKFMRTSRPGKACSNFIKGIEKLEKK